MKYSGEYFAGYQACDAALRDAAGHGHQYNAGWQARLAESGLAGWQRRGLVAEAKSRDLVRRIDATATRNKTADLDARWNTVVRDTLEEIKFAMCLHEILRQAGDDQWEALVRSRNEDVATAIARMTAATNDLRGDFRQLWDESAEDLAAPVLKVASALLGALTKGRAATQAFCDQWGGRRFRDFVSEMTDSPLRVGRSLDPAVTELATWYEEMYPKPSRRNPESRRVGMRRIYREKQKLPEVQAYLEAGKPQRLETLAVQAWKLAAQFLDEHGRYKKAEAGEYLRDVLRRRPDRTNGLQRALLTDGEG